MKKWWCNMLQNIYMALQCERFMHMDWIAFICCVHISCIVCMCYDVIMCLVWHYVYIGVLKHYRWIKRIFKNLFFSLYMKSLEKMSGRQRVKSFHLILLCGIQSTNIVSKIFFLEGTRGYRVRELWELIIRELSHTYEADVKQIWLELGAKIHMQNWWLIIQVCCSFMHHGIVVSFQASTW